MYYPVNSPVDLFTIDRSNSSILNSSKAIRKYFWKICKRTPRHLGVRINVLIKLYNFLSLFRSLWCYTKDVIVGSCMQMIILIIYKKYVTRNIHLFSQH